MSLNNSNSPVVSLAEYKAEAEVVRKSNGHRKGDHGNRSSNAMRAAAVKKLTELIESRGELTTADKEEVATFAGVSPRQVNRWWHRHCAQLVMDQPQNPEQPLRRWLLKFDNPNECQLNQDEVAFFASHTTIKNAIDAIHSDATHRLSCYGRSTLYRAYQNVAEGIREGARNGSAAGRRTELTYPTSGHDKINENWSIDEYDLKVEANDGRSTFWPKLLVVRERTSGAPIAYRVLKRAATSDDTGIVLACAAAGFTAEYTDAFGETHQVIIRGVARHLVSDQGSAFMGAGAIDAARRLGIGVNAVPSHTPQANGDHEVMHQTFLRAVSDGAGSRRGWTDLADKNLDHGVLPWHTVHDIVHTTWISLLLQPYTSSHRKGRTRLQMYKEMVDSGDIYDGPVPSDEDLAHFGIVVAEPTHDATRGLYWNGYWASPRFATVAKGGEKYTLKQLDDANVTYAYDKHGRYIDKLVRRDQAPDDHIIEVHTARAERARFVKSIGEARAQAALADAQARWDETADGLAVANANPAPAFAEDNDGTSDLHPVPATVPPPTKAQQDKQRENEQTELHATQLAAVQAAQNAAAEVLTAAGLSATPEALDADAIADAIADMVRTARNHDTDQRPPADQTEAEASQGDAGC